MARLLDPDWHVRRSAVQVLGRRGGAIMGPLMRALREQHHELGVLSSALDLLAASDVDVVEPLLDLLEDPEPDLRLQAALMLGARGDRRAGPALLRHLDDPDVNVRFHAIEALGQVGAAEASEALVRTAASRDFFLAYPAIEALGRLGNAACVPRLVPLLADAMLRVPTAEALGELGDDDVVPPLVRALDDPGAPADVIAAALARIAGRYEQRHQAGEHIAVLVRRHITPRATRQLLDAVGQAAPDRLPGLAVVLGWLEGEAAERALTRMLGREHVRPQVLEALVRHGSGVALLLADQLRAEDLEIRVAAAVALGRIGDRRAVPALVEALGDRDVAVAAAAAIARIGDASAFEALLPLLGDSDASIRQSAIAALSSIAHHDMPARIVELLDHADPLVRESALKIAGYFGYGEALARVLARCRDADAAVRRAAAEQLPFFDDPAVLPPLKELSGDASAAVRAAAVRALGQMDHPSRLEALRRALGDRDAWVRYMAVKSLAGAPASEAIGPVLSRLRDDPAPHVRLAAIEAVGRLRPPDAARILATLVESGNEDIAGAAIRALGHLDGAESFQALARELQAPVRWRRLAAIDGLALRAEPAVSPLLQSVLATASDDAIVDGAVDALRRVALRDETAGRAATHALLASGADPSSRPRVVAALGSLPPRRVADLAAGLQHESPGVRTAAVEALSRMRHPEASSALETALGDSEPEVRLCAVMELRHLGSRTSQRRLMDLARTDPDVAVREAARAAVARSA